MADTETHMTDSSQETSVKFKYTTFDTNFVASDNKKQEDLSLQEAFRRYREAKQDELRQARLLRKRQELRKADPQKMAALRQKFLNQAKKYYGYPYARKYWPPDSPEYKSKLFLDCCGLVRRVMRDLAEDFGFIIGPWNQAYMFDTLPYVVEREKDMKPGDLVFISAIYYNPKSKKQRHNMTHVEIWAGDGCKTIGARWNNGKVQTWDHYKFVAKSYHSETYHFRSIDTWLKGLCTSHCSQHFWRRSKYSPTKKSIFALPEQIEEDEAAGDDDDNVDTFNMRGNTFVSQDVSSVNKMLAQCKISEEERPKTQLDSPSVKNDSSVLRQTSAESLTDFPTIRNDLKGKGKNLNKRKKVKYVAGGRQKGSSSTGVTENRGREESCSSSDTAFSDLTGAENNLPDRHKESGQLTISGSLNDLGRKGLYLRDLVDSQKVSNDVEDVEGDADDGNIEGEALEDTEDQDFDDDYFIFVNDDDSDMEETAYSEHSDDSSEFLNGEDAESDNEKDIESKHEVTDVTEEKTITCGKESVVEKTAMNENNAESSNSEINVKVDRVDEKQAESSCEKGRTEGRCAGDIEHDREHTNADTVLKAKNVCKSLDPKKTCNDVLEKKSENKINVIENIAPFGSVDGVKSLNLKQTGNDENCNQNSNPKEEDKHQTKEKSRVQYLKASVITVVSQSGPSSSQTNSTSSPYGVSKSQATVRSQPEISFSQTSSSSQIRVCGSQATPHLPFLIPWKSKTSEATAKVDSPSSQLTDNHDNSESSTDSQDENSGKGSGKKGGEERLPAVGRMSKLPACSLHIYTAPKFYIGGGNGASLVEGPLTSLGWKRITNKYDEKFKLKWVDCRARINYSNFREGDQLVNHLPNSQMLTNKLGLLTSLQEYERVTLSTKGRLPRLQLSDFHPETYNLDIKGDRDLFLDVYKENEIWICKPIGWNQGKGIFLLRSREAIYKVLEEQEEQRKNPQKTFISRIVQRYITNPLLLEGRKFDVRAYMLIGSTVPFLILYHKGYVRLCCHKYDEDTSDLGRHLTNQFVQKKDPSYEKLKETTAWSMDKFNLYINEKVRPDCPVEIEKDWVFNTFEKQVKKIIIHLFNSVKHKLQSRIGFFDLYGLDFMVDTNMKVKLIEVNTNPALSCNCDALKEVIPGVVEESLYLAIECFEKSKRNLPLLPLKSLKNFTILYCGSRPNTNTSRQSHSVPPVRENTIAEKPKSPPQGQGGQRSLMQAAQIYLARSSIAAYRDAKSLHNAPVGYLTGGKTNRNLKFLSTALVDTQNENGVKDAKKTENEKDVRDAKKTENEKDVRDAKKTENERDVRDAKKTENEKNVRDAKKTENERDVRDAKKTENEKGVRDAKKTENERGVRDAKKTENEKGVRDVKKTENERDVRDAKKTENEKGVRDAKKTENERDVRDAKKTENEKGVRDAKKTENEKGVKDAKKTENEKDVRDAKKTENLHSEDKRENGEMVHKKSTETDPKKEKKDTKVNETLPGSSNSLKKAAFFPGRFPQSLPSDRQLKITHSENFKTTHLNDSEMTHLKNSNIAQSENSNTVTKPISAQSFRARGKQERGN